MTPASLYVGLLEREKEGRGPTEKRDLQQVRGRLHQCGEVVHPLPEKLVPMCSLNEMITLCQMGFATLRFCEMNAEKGLISVIFSLTLRVPVKQGLLQRNSQPCSAVG